MAPTQLALGSWGPFNPNWRLLGIAFCDKSFTGLQANPFKPWAPRAAARYPPSSPATLPTGEEAPAGHQQILQRSFRWDHSECGEPQGSILSHPL